MKFDRATRTQIYADMTLSLDPTGSTVEVKVDDTWHAATWQGSPVQAGDRWTQTALTSDFFAGPDATASGATVLAVGRHLTETRVTSGGVVVAYPSTPIDVS